ncbi:hypothetical protein [Hahella sp. HN01]|uniref:hypothetical protein n=1 Tax=Hahella sp. HN01 TaxID=2847262 RepID=UPI001C1F192D|nr:hypothetical protein [Hahella sp. HN01]MBU6953448.1 hypothetical protein [Hahella sp. HN01]
MATLKYILAPICLLFAAAHVNAEYWCGYSDDNLRDWRVNKASECRLPTGTGELVLIEAEKHFNVSSNTWFTPVKGRHPGAVLRKCEGGKASTLTGDTMLTTAKLQKICSLKKDGGHELLTSDGVQATVECQNYQATNIRIKTEAGEKDCGMPEVLKVATPHFKIESARYGLDSADVTRRGIAPEEELCSLAVTDPTYPEDLTIAFVWGDVACHLTNYYKNRHACGWFANDNGMRGSKMSSFYAQPVLAKLCQKTKDGEVEVTKPFRRLDNHDESLSYVKGYIQCVKGAPTGIKLAIKPLVGETQEKQCPIPEALLKDKPVHKS